MNNRFTVLLMIVFWVACSTSATPPVGTGSGPRSSGSPTGSLSDTTTSGSSSSNSPSLPSDVTQPPTASPPSSLPAICGNGVVETGEQCDDGNVVNWDGCTATCQSEAAPSFSDTFANITDALWHTKAPHGTLAFAVTDTLSSDQKVARLTFFGDQTNAAAPKNATQIATKSLLGFGMYRTRVNFGKCAVNEELVNGIFVYSYGGDTDGVTTIPVDGNQNGITDNNEIDFELLCGEPNNLYLTTWTDYQDVGGVETFLKVSRMVDMTTGDYYQTKPGKEGTYGNMQKLGNIPEAKIADFGTADRYYEIGFDWKSTGLRFFMMINGAEVTLWDFTDNAYIPQNKAFMMFNLWHTNSHWWEGGAAAYPSSDALLRVDWFKYWVH